MNYFEYVDSQSKNVESLRKARTFNDLAAVVTNIKASVRQIRSKVLKKLSSLNKEKISIETNLKAPNFSSLSNVYDDIHSLKCFSLELEYAKSMSFSIENDNKKKKFDTLVSEQISETNNVLNMVYKYIDSIGSRYEPKELVQYYRAIQKHCQTYIKYEKLNTFVLPNAEKNTSYRRYIILFNVVTAKGFIIPSVIICIAANTNYAEGYFYNLSFPSDVETPGVEYNFSNKNEMITQLTNKLTQIFGAPLLPIRVKSEALYKIPGINSVYTTDEALSVELDSGVSASDVNNILTQLLPLIYSLTGVSNTLSDVLHRVGIGPNGNRIIEFVLQGRTLVDRSSLSNLKKILSLSQKNVSSLLELLEK